MTPETHNLTTQADKRRAFLEGWDDGRKHGRMQERVRNLRIIRAAMKDPKTSAAVKRALEDVIAAIRRKRE